MRSSRRFRRIGRAVALGAALVAASGAPAPRDRDRPRYEEPGAEARRPALVVPADVRRRAWDARRPDASPAAWRPIGPRPAVPREPGWSPSSGRVDAIAVSPDDGRIVLVGSPRGGIWRSTDGGEHFEPVIDDEVDQGVGAIAFAPRDGRVVYAGMGGRQRGLGYLGSGVLKSTDAGATWAPVGRDALPPNAATQAIAVAPTDADRIFLAQSAKLVDGRFVASGFFVSEDGGTTWTQTLTGRSTDLALDPRRPNVLYLGIRAAEGSDLTGGVYKSVDAGRTWALAFASPFGNATLDVKLAVTRRGDVYAFTGANLSPGLTLRIDRSSDGGKKWRYLDPAGITPNQFGYNSYIAADPAHARTIYAGTIDLFKSVDGGKSWRNLTHAYGTAVGDAPETHPDQQSIAFSRREPRALFVGNDGGIWRSDDRGETFRSLNETLSLVLAQGLAVDPADPGISIAGAQDNGSVLRAAGDVWIEIGNGDGGDCAIDPVDPTIAFTTTQTAQVTRHTVRPAGVDPVIVATTFTFGEPPVRPRMRLPPPLRMHATRSILYLATWRLFTSDDRGETWRAPAPDTDLTANSFDYVSALDAAASDPAVVYTGSARGRVMRTTDGGATWTDVTAGLPEAFVTAIAVDPRDADVAYLCFDGLGAGRVFATGDGGREWRDVTGDLPAIPVSAALVDPLDANALYLGTDIGVFRSISRGTAWTYFGSGMPPVLVTKLVAARDGRIQAATYGRGVYEYDPRAARSAAPL